MTILEVHMPDSGRILLECLDWISTPEPVMPHVQAKANEVGIGKAHQCMHLSRCFDKAGTVVMGHRPEATGPLHFPGNALNPRGKDLPLLIRKSLVLIDPPGVFRPDGILADPFNQGGWLAVHILQDFFNITLGGWAVPLVTIAFPLRLREYALHRDSGGPGRFRGDVPRRQSSLFSGR